MKTHAFCYKLGLEKLDRYMYVENAHINQSSSVNNMKKYEHSLISKKFTRKNNLIRNDKFGVSYFSNRPEQKS